LIDKTAAAERPTDFEYGWCHNRGKEAACGECCKKVITTQKRGKKKKIFNDQNGEFDAKGK